MLSDTAPPAPDARHRPFDITVAGAGVVGLALAIALARAGFSVAAVGPPSRERNGRTVALLDGSVRMLDAMGAWAAVRERAAPLATMRIVDGTSSLFRGPPVSFRAGEIGLPAFGYNVENADLLESLEAVAAGTPGLERWSGTLASFQADGAAAIARLESGDVLRSALVIAADGARSRTREAAGIPVREDTYPQVALTTILIHDRAHGDVSTEFHTRQGPCTLVPMTPDAGGRHRSSLVWVMEPAEAGRRLALDREHLAREVEHQTRLVLGAVQITGAVGRFPIRRLRAARLVGPRIALAGEAAHALPPIGAQGLNLSLRDGAALAEILAAARRAGHDIGSPTVLARYAEARSGDIDLRSAGVHALNMALLTPALPIDAVRGLGLAALAALPGLRRAVMRSGLKPTDAAPGPGRQRPAA